MIEEVTRLKCTGESPEKLAEAHACWRWSSHCGKSTP
jgi:hypothetical protein